MDHLFLFFLLLSESAKAHTFTGMIGFYDGISHPVLGLDHFLAMVSVGIISSQIGGRYIWIIPSVFVIMMICGCVIGMVLEINQMGLLADKKFYDKNSMNDIEIVAKQTDSLLSFTQNYKKHFKTILSTSSKKNIGINGE